MDWRDELRRITKQIPAGELPEAIGELARVQAMLSLQLSSPPHDAPSQPSWTAKDRYLTAEAIAERFGISIKWVYEHKRELGGVKLDGAVRFSERAVKRYVEARRL